MSQSTTLSPALSPEQLAAMDGEQIVKMGRELLAQLDRDPDGVHGNIWPGNIHIDEDGKAVLGEGSIAPVSARTPEQIEYMSPEAFWDNDFSRAADLYSIALIMYTAYNGGRLPFTDSDEPSDAERAQALRTRMKGGELTLPESVSEDVGEILRRELAYSPEGRYLTGDSMLHDLSETDEALPSAAPEDEPPSDAEAAASAAATGLAGVSAVAEPSAMPREEARPIEAAAGVSASSILMEQELNEMDTPEDKPAKARIDTPPLAAIFATPVAAQTREPEGEDKIEDKAEAPTEILTDASAEESAPKKPQTTAKKPSKQKNSAQKNEAKPKTEADTKPEGKPKTEAKPQTEASSKAEAKPKSEAKTKTETKAKTEAKPKGEPVRVSSNAGKPKATSNTDKSKTAPLSAAKKPAAQKAAPTPRKIRSGTLIAIGAGALVIAGLICVTAYSLGAFETEPTPLTAATIPPQTVQTTAEPSTPTPTLPVYSFTALATTLDWDELTDAGLAVLDGQEALDAAIAAAEKAGLESLWLGARYLDAADAPDGEAGWYWLDGTQLPKNSSLWAEGEPSTDPGGRLMLRHSATDGSWGFHAVTRSQFQGGGFTSLGYITDGSGMVVKPSPSPTPTTAPTLTPAPTVAPSSSSRYVYVPTAAPTTAPSTQPSTPPTTEPVTPSTKPVSDYTALPGTDTWTTVNTSGKTLATATTAEKHTAIVKFLDDYNSKHSDAPLRNVWLGAQYLEADESSSRTAGWYWLDGTALTTTDTNWATGESAKTTDCKLMLRYVDGAWKYYAVTDAEFTAALDTTYTHSGALTVTATETTPGE